VAEIRHRPLVALQPRRTARVGRLPQARRRLPRQALLASRRPLLHLPQALQGRPRARPSVTTAPRTILYTGNGGVGKTSVAAATARRCAAAGLRTVVLSPDPAHRLSDSLAAPLGSEPTPVCKGLWGQEVQAQREMEVHWGAVQKWLGQVL